MARARAVKRWAERRSRAVAMLGSGLSLGTLVALPVTGWLVRSQGWPSPFYIFGALGLVWAIPWFFGVGSGRGVEAEAAPGSRTIPWGRILSTPAVWAIIINHFCNNWSLYVLLAWLPSYFKTTFGVTIASAGILSAAPWAVSFVMANVAGGWADRMIRGGRHPTTVRKTMQLIGLLGGAAGLLLLQQVGSVTMGLVVMCFASGALAFCLAGFGPNAFDVAPKYADVVWGISNTAATIPGIIGVAVTGWLVDRTGGYTAPFVVTAGIAVFGAVVYALFGSGERKID